MSQFRNNDFADNTKLRSLRGWFKRRPFQNITRNNNLNHTNGSEKHYVENTCFAWNMTLLTDKEKLVQQDIFRHWKMYVIHKLEQRKKVCLVDNLFRRRLKRRFLAALLTNVVLERCKTNHKVALANNLRKQKILLKVYFAFWMKYVREEQIAKINIAQYFSETMRLKKSLYAWKGFASRQKGRKLFEDEMLKASKYYTTILLRKSLNRWLYIYSDLKWKSNMARAMYNDKILKKYYNAWIKFHKIKQTKFCAREDACQYFEKKLLQRSLKTLILHVTLNTAKRSLQQQATEFYAKRQLTKLFFTWIHWCSRKKEVCLKVETAQRNFDIKLERITFRHWQSFVHDRKCKRRKLFLVTNLMKKRFQRMGFKILKHYLSYRKQKKIHMLPLVEKGQVIKVKVQKIYILKWRRQLYDVMQEKREIQRAVEFYDIRHIRKYFSHWKRFSHEYKVKTNKKRQLQELASTFMTKRYLILWIAEYKKVSILREKESHIVCTLKQKTLNRHFSYWKKFAKRKIEERIGIEAAKEVYGKFLLRASLRQMLKVSLYQIELSQQNRLHYATAMSVERFQTLEKYFHCWLMLTHRKLNLKDLPTEQPLSIMTNISKFTNITLPQYMLDHCNNYKFINNPAIVNRNSIINKF